MVGKKLSGNEGVLRESSGFDQRTVEGGIMSRGMVEDAGEGGEIAFDKIGRVQSTWPGVLSKNHCGSGGRDGFRSLVSFVV
jgi:hypothetical protein